MGELEQRALFDDLGPVAPAKRQRKRRDRAHAATPGSGPEGETCKTCAHLRRRGTENRTYLKCWLMHGGWTLGPGTDIRARDEACVRWEPDA